ncbi:hypothetical protein BaRGS_00024991 [Batillaria attramentaria]|uniref:Uncharacterized protein n=1 Tax=Batillaria attramentaria TaxID=370345 RepID=A0ABD0K9I8_9CAEN
MDLRRSAVAFHQAAKLNLDAWSGTEEYKKQIQQTASTTRQGPKLSISSGVYPRWPNLVSAVNGIFRKKSSLRCPGEEQCSERAWAKLGVQ